MVWPHTSSGSAAASGGRPVKLSSDLIYEAALDDQLFAELPSILAKATGARSCVLHWRDEQGAAEIFAHSGYFSDQNMSDYAANFVGHDLWTEAGMKQGFVNRAWRTSDLVASEDYERSIFFNEWIRPMGDDTFYCSGSVMRTVHGDGIVGIHRGRQQGDFTPATLRQLNQHVEHLRRMFAIRARLSLLDGQNQFHSAIVSSNDLASLLLDRSGRILMASPAAEELIRQARLLRCRDGIISAVLHGDEESLRQALALASLPDPQGSTFLLRERDGHVRVATAAPLAASANAPRAVLLSIDSPRKARPAEIVRRQLIVQFGLSDGECDVALRLADGFSLGEISEQRLSAIGTVRTQLKHVLSKMNARRQSEVVGMIERLRAGLEVAGR